MVDHQITAAMIPPMDEQLTTFEVITRLIAATLGGGLLGWERQVQEKTAGLRTHMMVSLGSATIVVIGHQIVGSIHDPRQGILQLDPLRLLEAVIGGVGFLGAGAIIQSRGSVRGLTTAASVWLSASVGLGCGLGYYLIAGTSALLGLAILLLIKVVDTNNGSGETAKTGEASADEGSEQVPQ